MSGLKCQFTTVSELENSVATEPLKNMLKKFGKLLLAKWLNRLISVAKDLETPTVLLNQLTDDSIIYIQFNDLIYVGLFVYF